jgi:hypothetical protein
MRKIGVIWAKKNVLLAILAIIFVFLVMSVYLFSQEFKEGLTRSDSKQSKARTPQETRTAEARSIDATRIADVKKAINMRNRGAIAKRNASATDFRSFKVNNKGEIIKGKYSDFYGKRPETGLSSWTKGPRVFGGMLGGGGMLINTQGKSERLIPETDKTSIAAIPVELGYYYDVATAASRRVPDTTISFATSA